MRICLCFPKLPPSIDGIGSHTALLAEALVRRGHEVTICTESEAALGASSLVDGVELVGGWSAPRAPRAQDILNHVRFAQPDAVLLQFEQFSWGRRGFNPSLATMFIRLRALGRLRPRLVLFAHENYTYPSSFRRVFPFIYQVIQFTMLVRSADLVILSSEAWRRGWDMLGVEHLVIPTFSNIERTAMTRQLDSPIRQEKHCVWFGNIDESREAFFAAAAMAVAACDGAVLVYVGIDSRVAVRLAGEVLDDRLEVRGVLSDPAVSSTLTRASICLAPFARGVSSRRGSFMAALQHGLTVITTVGPETDPSIRGLISAGVVLATKTDPAQFSAEVARVLGSETPLSNRLVVERAYEDRFSADVAAAAVEMALTDRRPERATT